MLGSIARRSVVLSSRRSATRTRELRNLRRAGRSEYVGYPVITPPPRPLDGGRGHRGVSGTLRPIEGLEFV
jgi:hypothetical protein